MSTTELHYLGLVEVGQQIHARKLSPVEVTKAMLERIERLDGKLKSYAYVMADSALAEAAAAEKEIASGKIKGPLHGVPIAVKDDIAVAGQVATMGTRTIRTPAVADAEAVRRLRAPSPGVVEATTSMLPGSLLAPAHVKPSGFSSEPTQLM